MGRVTNPSSSWWILAVVFFLFTGCGDTTGGEYVWVQVFNAYPGSQGVSVYGPSGTITSNLKFGQRTSKFIKVNRNLGTELRVVMQGAPRPFTGNVNLYELYPQESVTLVINRRTGPGQVGLEMVRHVQSALHPSPRLRGAYNGPTCRTVMANRISVGNSGIADWTVVPRLGIESACTGYARNVGSYDACDPDLGRPDLMRAMFGPDACNNGSIDPSDASQWFIPVTASSGPTTRQAIASTTACTATSGSSSSGGSFNTGTFRGSREIKWIFAGPEKVSNKNAALAAYAADVDPARGRLAGAQPTIEFMNCIGYDRSLSLQQNRMNIDPETVEECRAGTTYSTVALRPNQDISRQTILETSPGLGVGRGPDQCGFPIQVRSDFLNIYEDPQEGDVSLVDSESDPITYPPGQYYFWFLYGRPINPRIESWSVEAEGDTPGGTIDPGKYPDGER